MVLYHPQQNFLDLFQTRSKTRPRLLFNLYHRDSRKKFIFSAPEHTDDDKSSSSSVMARYDMPISAPRYNVLYGSVNGFFCFRGVSSHTITVYNPTTRQVVKLPDAKPNGRHMTALLGYDPVEDQYKVLCVVMREGQGIPQEHLVCTVSSSHDEKQEWRKIENTTGDYYHNICGDICIDGALCYGVSQSRIVRFDVRSEKIDYIKTPKLESYIHTTYMSILINYKGKLAVVNYCFTKKLMRLWVLEDAEKQEWSSMTYVLPSKLEDLPESYLKSRGVIHTGELMVFRELLDSSKPFYVCYYDFNKKIIRKVEIRGMKDGDFRHIHGTNRMLCYPGHIENIRFL